MNWQLLRTFKELESLENISLDMITNRIGLLRKSWFLLGKSVTIRNPTDMVPISDVEDAENRILEFREEVEEINPHRSSRVWVWNVFCEQSATIVNWQIIMTIAGKDNNDYHNGIRYLMIDMTSLRRSLMIEWYAEVGVRSVSSWCLSCWKISQTNFVEKKENKWEPVQCCFSIC